MATILIALLIVAAAGAAVLTALSLMGRSEKTIREELSRNREEMSLQTRGLREEIGNVLRGQTDSLLRTQEGMRQTLQERIRELQQENSAKLSEMRQTVDEKLHATLERRLSESFRLVSERLEAVQKGLGEMQSLASGVGDLRRLLGNVKSRGTWGEIQLKTLVSELLTREQYGENVRIKPSSAESVELAIRLPGRAGEMEAPVWLPIDSKFPLERYERVVEARERADSEALAAALKALVEEIKTQARKIRDKYIAPPHSTDFAIMYLPIEGLYAEVTQAGGLLQALQRDHRVVVSGPSTLAALLNSLQMGFRTMAIEKKSAEVWRLLGAIKTEFIRFGEILEKTQQKIDSVRDEIEKAASKSRTIARRLNKVQEIPVEEGRRLLGDSDGGGEQ